MFVGRIAESAQLVASLSRSRPTVVVGPPGIGKSALANAAAQRATDDVVVARGIATLTTVPFLLFRNQLDIEGGDGPDDVADRLCRHAPGALVLDEKLTLRLLVALAMIAAGIVIVNRPRPAAAAT